MGFFKVFHSYFYIYIIYHLQKILKIQIWSPQHFSQKKLVICMICHVWYVMICHFWWFFTFFQLIIVTMNSHQSLCFISLKFSKFNVLSGYIYKYMIFFNLSHGILTTVHHPQYFLKKYFLRFLICGLRQMPQNDV